MGNMLRIGPALIWLAVSLPTQADTPADTSELHLDPAWLTLIHYQPDTFGDGYTSQADVIVWNMAQLATAAIDIALAVNNVNETTPCGEGCTVYGDETSAPVMTWIHGGAHVYPRSTSERIGSFFRQHSRTP